MQDESTSSSPSMPLELLISSHAGLMWFAIDDEWEVRDAALLSSGYHYGIGADIESKRFYAYRGGMSVSDESSRELLVFDEASPPRIVGRHVLAPGLGSVHQIAWGNGGLYIANTKHNSVAFCDARGRLLSEFNVGGHINDFNHVNSVFVAGNYVAVMLHNFHRIESQVVILEHGEGFREVTRKSLWHSQCHNLFFEPSRMWYNASQARTIVVADPLQNEVLRQWRFDEHTKGLAVTDQWVICGMSDYTDVESRGRSAGSLVIIDRQDLQHLATIPLSLAACDTAIGNINEVRAIRPVDRGQSGDPSLLSRLSEVDLARASLVRFALSRAKSRTLYPARALRRSMRSSRRVG